MQGYEIGSLKWKIQDLIKSENLDQNGDGLINEENGELAALLSKSGAKDINELRSTVGNTIGCIFQGTLGAAIGGIGGVFYKNSELFRNENCKVGVRKILHKVREDVITEDRNLQFYMERRITPKEKAASIERTLSSYRSGRFLANNCKKIFAAMVIAGGYMAFDAIRDYFNPPKLEQKDSYIHKTDNNTQVNTEPPKKEENELKTKFEEGFRELGISEDTNLKEYIPQRGEYWISILKAKYGVDDKTAQSMANKIKEMVYEDPKAAKQTPVMYLPETWTFEGKTYQYNDSVQAAKTQTYSDDIKTEMGKMNKDIKY